MNNIEVVDAIRQETNAFLEKVENIEERKFSLSQLEIKDGIFLDDIKVEDQAMKNILNRLQIKKGFIDFSKVMAEGDWDFIAKKLKSMDSDTVYYAQIMQEGDAKRIVNTFPHNEEKKKEDSARYRQYLDWICDSLTSTDKEYSLKGIHIDPKLNSASITLLENREVDVFGSNQDLWKIGDQFTFNGLQFNYNPFFERLVCTNGMTTMQHGFGASVNQSRFNNGKIESVIRKAIEEQNFGLEETLKHASDHLSRNNVSIAEFNYYKKIFENANEDGKYDKVLYEFFDERPFYSAYGENIEEKSYKWKSTANTGINAYDFLNMLTWLASHSSETGFDTEMNRLLQMRASDLMFKKELDLEDVATSVKIEYPRHLSMN